MLADESKILDNRRQIPKNTQNKPIKIIVFFGFKFILAARYKRIPIYQNLWNL
jgi:uncharacterized protein YlaI